MRFIPDQPNRCLLVLLVNLGAVCFASAQLVTNSPSIRAMQRFSGQDCNSNGISDEDDIALGTSADCDSDGIPDECPLPYWATSPRLIPYYWDASQQHIFETLPIAAGPVTMQLTTFGNFQLYSSSSHIFLNDTYLEGAFCCHTDCSSYTTDELMLPASKFNELVRGGEARFDFDPGSKHFECHVFPNSFVQIQLLYDRDNDCNHNGISDQCDLQSGLSADANANKVPDECPQDGDCNRNLIGDLHDIVTGTSSDCNGNGIPDDCEVDCNSNANLDACDIDQGISNDANSNGIPDECAEDGDCNENGIGDLHDILIGTSDDCNEDSVVDGCQGGCNDNRSPDECDIESGRSNDANGNGIPDECAEDSDCNNNGVGDLHDILVGTSRDCSGDSIPDECQLDCNGNQIHDACDIEDGSSNDANNNGIPDECASDGDCNLNGVGDLVDLLNGISIDCDHNRVPDECQDDCNGNGVEDACDIDSRTSKDCQQDGVPDECQLFAEFGSALSEPADACFDAQPILSGYSYSGTTVGADGDGISICNFPHFFSPDVWFSYTPTFDGTVRISLCGSDFDALLTLHTACNIGDFVCGSDLCGAQSALTLSVSNGQTLYLRVAGDQGVSGSFDLTMTAAGSGTGGDCNGNGVPDQCDIDEGLLSDADGDGLADLCQ